jgi:hypothetical protein
MTTPLDLPATGRPKALYGIPEAMRLLSLSRTVSTNRSARAACDPCGKDVPASSRPPPSPDYVDLLEAEADRRAA